MVASESNAIIGYAIEVRAPDGEWVEYGRTKECSFHADKDLLQHLTNSTSKTFYWRVKTLARKGSGLADSDFVESEPFTFPDEEEGQTLPIE